jgi:hypothetical protein
MSSVPLPRQEVFEMEVESGFLPKRDDMMAIGISLGVHLVALIVLGMIHYEVLKNMDQTIDSAMTEDINELQYKFEDISQIDQIGNGSPMNLVAPSQEAASKVGDTNPEKDVQKEIEAPLEQPVPTLAADIPQPSKDEYANVIQTRGATEHPGGVEGAVDRLAWEIANSLREGKTLVVWIFDVSPSLAKRREIIADRVETVYNQLNKLNVDADKALMSTVVAFSDKHTFITPDPVGDAAEVVKAVRSIRSESSGTENVFSAIVAATNKWLNYRTKMHRRMMMVVVTDEAGSDAEAMLDKAILLTKRYGIRCYVVGDAAPFGRATTESPFTLESGEEVIGVMDNGPETFLPDLVKLPYWGVNGGDLEQMSSGFGPYALTRLAAETNGLFLVSKESGRHRFDPQIMRNYAPDYRPISMIRADISKNNAKRALIDAAMATNSLVPNQPAAMVLPVPRLEFPAENDTVLRQAITEAQKPVADLDYRLTELQTRLEQGEKDRAKIGEARWQAAYDVALGRVLALRVRSYGYNLMLADMKVNPKKFEKAGSNRWRLVASNNVSAGQVVKKMAAKANDYLNRVIDQHGGTPWQVMAEREKSAPLGWEWKEETYAAPAGGNNGGNAKGGPRFIEEVDPKTGKKVRRQLPDQPVKQKI